MKTLHKQNLKLWVGIIVLLLAFTFLSRQQAQAGVITDSFNSGVNWAKNSSTYNYVTNSRPYNFATKTIGSLSSINVNSIKTQIPALNTSFSLEALSSGVGAMINKSRNIIQSNYLARMTQNNSIFNAMSNLSMTNIIGGIGSGLSAMGRILGIQAGTNPTPAAGKAFVFTRKTLKIESSVITMSNLNKNF